jgi:Ser/Thr protein kinase RdoA (MazF antagonist)
MNADGDIPPPVLDWLEQRGWEPLEKVKGGRNNRLFRVSNNHQTAALKIHRRTSNDSRDRFGTERAFYSLARSRGASVAKWIDDDPALGIALLGWIDGAPVQASPDADSLRQASDFLSRINEPPLEFPFLASEACFSTRDHVDLIRRRLRGLCECGSPDAAEFSREALAPFVEKAVAHLASHPLAEFRGRRIFSPGDFGFHNALSLPDGGIVFLDFEYAGWDDPAKTVADIFLQPERPVDWCLLAGFCEHLRQWPDLAARTALWIPFLAAKWAIILLNPALHSPSVEMHSIQIEKARALLARGVEGLR